MYHVAALHLEDKSLLNQHVKSITALELNILKDKWHRHLLNDVQARLGQLVIKALFISALEEARP